MNRTPIIRRWEKLEAQRTERRNLYVAIPAEVMSDTDHAAWRAMEVAKRPERAQIIFVRFLTPAPQPEPGTPMN